MKDSSASLFSSRIQHVQSENISIGHTPYVVVSDREQKNYRFCDMSWPLEPITEPCEAAGRVEVFKSVTMPLQATGKLEDIQTY